MDKLIIDNIVFHVKRLPATEAADYTVEALQLLLGSAGGGGNLAMLGALASKPELKAIIARLRSRFAELSQVEISADNGDIRLPELRLVFDQIFTGKNLTMWKWFYECLRLNFSDFLDMLEKSKKAQEALKQAKQTMMD